MIRVVGTGHIFEKSAQEVRSAAAEECPDIIAIELDKRRFLALEERNWRLDPGEDAGLLAVLKAAVGGGSFPVLLEGVLGLIQKELGQELGIMPGSDMLAAVQSAKERGCRIALIDRDIEVTINHVLSTPLKEKMRLFSARKEDSAALEAIGADAEAILKEENVAALLGALRKDLPTLYSALVDERDRYMAAALLRLRQTCPDARILAVVGAGHRRGLEDYLNNPEKISSRDLTDIRPVSRIGVLALLIPATAAYIWMKIKFRNRK